VKRDEAVKSYDAEEATLRARLGTIDPFSPKQLMDYVYNEHGVKPVYRLRKKVDGKARTPSLDETAIDELLTRVIPQEVSDVLRLVLRIRELHKITSVYLKAPLDRDGRLRCSYIITGTETGRISSRETAFHTGTNLQNVPEGIAREVVVPDDGMVFVGADLSQAEARIVAYLAGETRLTALFDRGGDIHRGNAARIFRKPEAAVTPTERYIAKRIIHASNYGMGANKFAQVAGVTKAEAKALLHQYFNTYPRIKVWHLQVADTIKRTRTLTTPLGRTRQFMGPWGDDLLREAYAFVPQSTVSDLLNDGLIQYHHEGPGEIVLQVHDSIVVQVPGPAADLAATKLRQCLTRPVDINGHTCTIPVDIKRGCSWDALK